MQNRNNKDIAAAVKNGISISRIKGDAYAFLSLKKSNVPDKVILRVLFQPHKIRGSDLYNLEQPGEVKLNH